MLPALRGAAFTQGQGLQQLAQAGTRLEPQLGSSCCLQHHFLRIICKDRGDSGVPELEKTKSLKTRGRWEREVASLKVAVLNIRQDSERVEH